MISYEFGQFLNEKVLDYLPANKVRVGDKWNFRCPICHDSAKSATKKRGWWYNASHSYYCFNCSTGMSGIKFLEFISGNDFTEIKKEYTRLFLKSGLSAGLSSTYQIPSSEPSLFELQPIVKPEWKNPLSEEAKAYLDSRLVTKSPFFHNDMYSWKNSKGNEYILINWVLNGIDAYFQLNDFKKHGSIKYIFPKDKKKTVYGLDNIDMSFPYLFVFEGVYDSLFIKNGLAVGTKAITDYQLRLIKERYPKHQIVVSFDNDKAGLDAMCKLVKINENLKFFKWFDSSTKEKDINELIISKNDVNIFNDPAVLEKMTIDKLKMKLYLIQNNCWIR